MGLFRNFMKSAENAAVEALITAEKVEESMKETEVKPQVEKEEEWVWVEGYKGMDKDMRCHGGFQYELGKRYDMPDGAVIEECCSGYHLCLKLTDVYQYVSIGENNRFFQVKALVRKSDLERYRSDAKIYYRYSTFPAFPGYIDKLAAKSIEIVRELTADEILEPYDCTKWDEKYKQLALSVGINTTRSTMDVDELVGYGYSSPFAWWLVSHDKCKIARVVGSQQDLSMDVKVLMIMNG